MSDVKLSPLQRMALAYESAISTPAPGTYWSIPGPVIQARDLSDPAVLAQAATAMKDALKGLKPDELAAVMRMLRP